MILPFLHRTFHQKVSRLKKRLKIRKWYSEFVNRRTDLDNTIAKEKGQKDKQQSTKHTHKTKDQVTQTPIKNLG